MSRTARLRYSLAKVGVGIASGILVVFLSKILFLIGVTVIIKILHGEITIGDHLMESFSGTLGAIGSGDPDVPHWVLRQNFLLYIGQITLCDCLYASIFPAIAFAVSTFCTNKYIVLLSAYIYAEIMDTVFIGLKLYYISLMVLDYRGRAGLLSHNGIPFHIIVVLMYWVVETLIFVYGVNREMKKEPLVQKEVNSQ